MEASADEQFRDTASDVPSDVPSDVHGTARPENLERRLIMLPWLTLMNAAMAAAIVTLTPGPGMLAFLTLGAAQGRRDGAWFLAGHLAGD
ncbi:MAG: hypothetical protein ABWY00_08965, partial [Dongiaceae bacterium]